MNQWKKTTSLLIVIVLLITTTGIWNRPKKPSDAVPVYTFEVALEDETRIAIEDESLIPLEPENLYDVSNQNIDYETQINTELTLNPRPPWVTVSEDNKFRQDEVISLMGCSFEVVDVQGYKTIPDFIQEDCIIIFEHENVWDSNHQLNPGWTFMCIILKITNEMDEDYAYYVSNGNFVLQNEDGSVLDSGNEVRYHAVLGEEARTGPNRKDGYRNLIPAHETVTAVIGYMIHDSMFVQDELLYLIDAAHGDVTAGPDQYKAFVIDVAEAR